MLRLSVLSHAGKDENRSAATAQPSMSQAKDSAIAAQLAERQALVEWLHARAEASRWRLSLSAFGEALARSAEKRFGSIRPSGQQLEEYFSTLHLEDLALACACGENIEAAWEHFVEKYRRYLRAAAGAILRLPAESASACDLADALFADLYGWKREPSGKQSLFRYFHGRSKLSTWLRAVLAQRHVDAIRAQRRLEPLDPEAEGQRAPLTRDSSSSVLVDPDRARYIRLFQRALDAALSRLETRDRQRLAFYYAEDLTLAEIGRRLGEHESSVSRNLDRVRCELRKTVEAMLRAGTARADGHAAQGGLSDAQIALCLEYAVEDAPLDLSKALGRTIGPAAGGKKP